MAKYPAIPEPTTDVKALRQTVMALKEAVEMMTRQRGTSLDSVVTWGDLVRLELVEIGEVPKINQAVGS